MPRNLKLKGLRADLAEVESLLREAEKARDPVGELQYSHRANSIRNEIASLESEQTNAANVSLFFGGAPVLGSKGIAAEFAGGILEAFQDLVSRAYANAEYGSLGRRGPVPLKQNTQLMVTELARGSFGFVLEELTDQADLEKTALRYIVEEIDEIVRDTASPEEPDFEAVLERVDARTLLALQHFFVKLDSSDATLRVVDDAHDYVLDHGAINRGRTRTEATAIDELEDVMSGRLVGFLPEHRKFELKTDEDITIYGSVSKEAAQQFQALVNTGREILGNHWSIRAMVRTVTPLNRPPRVIYHLVELLEARESDV